MISRGKAEQQSAREARLAAALRKNLKRRKAQARARARKGATKDFPEIGGTPTPGPDFRRNQSSE
jgi:hypothetical protein